MHTYWKKRLRLILFLLFLLIPGQVKAESFDYIIDEAGLFTKDEIHQLNTIQEEIKKEYSIDIVVITKNKINESGKQYLENYYDSHDGLLSDAVLLCINMDSENRGVVIQGYGACEYTIGSERIERILDDIVPLLTDEEYADAVSRFFDQVRTSMETGAKVTTPHTINAAAKAPGASSSFVVRSLINLLISMAAGGFITFIFVHRTRGKITVDRNTYLSPDSSDILGRYDRYTHTTTSRRPKPKPPEPKASPSQSDGGVSPGGHSHSGGGRSF